MASTTNVSIYLTHPDINSGSELQIDDGGNSNIEKLEMGALDFMRTLVDRTGLGLEWRRRVVQGLKDAADVEVKAYYAAGGTGTSIKIASIFKALFEDDRPAELKWEYDSGANPPTVRANFLIGKWNLPTAVGDLTMAAATFSFEGSDVTSGNPVVFENF